MATAPETRVWSGRVGGDPALECNRHYRLDVGGRSGILESMRFRAFPYGLGEPSQAQVLAMGPAGSGGSAQTFGALNGVMWEAASFFSGMGDVRGVAWSPHTRTLVAAASTGVWVSADRGASWSLRLAWNKYSVVYAPELRRFVAVGENRSQAWSDDGGATWVMSPPPGDSPYLSVAWSAAASCFLMVQNDLGGRGYVRRSVDGGDVAVLVQSDVLGFGVMVRAVCWAGALGRFVVVGDGGRWRTSVNGTAWPTPPAPIPGAPALYAVASAPYGRVMVVGYGGFTAYTDDLVSWTVGGGGYLSDMYAVIYTGLVWIAVGGPDGGGVVSILRNDTDGVGAWSIAYTDLGAGAPPYYGLALVGAAAAPVIGRGEPYVNVILESRGRPAASQRFPVSMFSLGSVAPLAADLSQSANVVDIPLRLGWELGPGDVVRIDTPLALDVAVEFQGTLLMAPEGTEAAGGVA